MVLRLMKAMTPKRRRTRRTRRRWSRLLEEHSMEILDSYALPEAHRERISTTNMLERQNQELKRRARVLRVFPHEISLLKLTTALLTEANQE
jgi:transposase-like protein